MNKRDMKNKGGNWKWPHFLKKDEKKKNKNKQIPDMQ